MEPSKKKGLVLFLVLFIALLTSLVGSMVYIFNLENSIIERDLLIQKMIVKDSLFNKVLNIQESENDSTYIISHTLSYSNDTIISYQELSDKLISANQRYNNLVSDYNALADNFNTLNDSLGIAKKVISFSQGVFKYTYQVKREKSRYIITYTIP